MQKVKIARKFKESVHLLFFKYVQTQYLRKWSAIEEGIQNIQDRAY